ncbi:hypothetical protein [Rhodanobacter sp. A1T4]|uniref:hypothetical protein n=1 Tax=Rhodanobacter sp. A1T4 TaxID=2723087 RepID=UPI0016081563|nr:hypothetical protein [Rhodanobacter sp. A1T4]MBB6249156.1 hypothetical protein [Rhodanobacter sp. A1T4]
MFEKLISLLPSLHGTRGLVYLSIAVSVFSPTVVVSYLVNPGDFQFVDLAHLFLVAAGTGSASLLIAAAVYLLLELGAALGKMGSMLRLGKVPNEAEKMENSQDALARTALSLSGFGSLIVQASVATKVVALHLSLGIFVADVFVCWWQIAPFLGSCIVLFVSVGMVQFILGRRASEKRKAAVAS